MASATHRYKAAAALEHAKSTLAALETQLAASASREYDKLHAIVERARARVKRDAPSSKNGTKYACFNPRARVGRDCVFSIA